MIEWDSCHDRLNCNSSGCCGCTGRTDAPSSEPDFDGTALRSHGRDYDKLSKTLPPFASAMLPRREAR